MLILLIIGFIFILLGTIIGFYFDVNPMPTLFVSFGVIFIIFGKIGLDNENKPSALDVYKGKTTIEITYKDGVPIDSIVVFKDKNK